MANVDIPSFSGVFPSMRIDGPIEARNYREGIDVLLVFPSMRIDGPIEAAVPG